ncbi:hematopoietic SH2 domain-containing protein isoform X3 [Symphalangus syndactylus]|uniref:hematopoietic SH2 domain-containing protein isoform X3 n=1 Tax=Symphalangus syndactylus TaxID=9590 RepID=UPI002442D365|nr:hematopoietic SH2 domain-containing protein isoform X5 [Symphalangus syndactylus]
MTEARKPPLPLPPRLDWFVHTQVGQLAQDGVPEWFHGAISREDAENLLESQPLGSFLIRVSHSHVGYTLSYKAQSSCCHFMVKLLDDGTFMIPGEKVAHTSLDALVTFHQQKPIEPRRELLTQPCRRIPQMWIMRISSSTPTQWPRKLPARCLPLRSGLPKNVPPNPIYLWVYMLPGCLPNQTVSSERLETPSGLFAFASPTPLRGPAILKASPKPVLCHQSKERKPSTEMDGISTEEATSSCPPKAPLGETRQKLWRSLKMLPQRSQRVRQQLKSHLATVNLSSLLDVRRSTVISGPGTGKGSQDHSGDPTSGNSGYTDLHVATSLKSPSQPQAPKDRKVPTRKAERSASCIEVTPGDRSWHQMVVRALSSQESKPEHQGLAEPENDQLPEEYQQPPPFAPGYC